MSNLKEKLDRFVQTVDLRLSDIERKLTIQQRANERFSEDFNSPTNSSHFGTSIPPLFWSVAISTGQPDTQGELQSLKGSLSKVKIPAEVKLNDSRQ